MSRHFPLILCQPINFRLTDYVGVAKPGLAVQSLGKGLVARREFPGLSRRRSTVEEVQASLTVGVSQTNHF